MATFSPARPWRAKTRLAPARPQGVRRPKRIPFPPAHPELLRQLNHRGYVAGRRTTENAAGGHFQHHAKGVDWKALEPV